MKKRKLFRYVMTGALLFGIIGGGIHTFAATNSTSNSASAVEQAVNVKASMNNETKEKIQAIVEQLKSELSDLGVELPEKGHQGDAFANLDEATKVKAQSLIDDAKAQLAELGVDHLPFGGF